MSSSQAQKHSLERKDVMRALIESRRLYGKELVELSLTNTAIYRLVYLEKRLYIIRHVPFHAQRKNPMWCYIERDMPEVLKEALELAEFEDDKRGDVHRPHEQARSPVAVAWLSRRLPKDTDYMSILVEQCSIKYTHPAVVETTMDLIPPEIMRNVSPTPSRPNTLTHAIAAAASVLHIPLTDLLLRRKPTVFFKDGTALCSTTAPNPLHNALSFALPGKPQEKPRRFCLRVYPLHPEDFETPGPPDIAKLKKDWIHEARQTAFLIHAAVLYLLEQAKVELQGAASSSKGNKPKRQQQPPGPNQQLLTDLLDTATLVYLHNLREFLLNNLTWLLSDVDSNNNINKLRDDLLTPASAARKTIWSSTPLFTALNKNHLLRQQQRAQRIRSHPEIKEVPKLEEIDFEKLERSDFEKIDWKNLNPWEWEGEQKQAERELAAGNLGETALDVTWREGLFGAVVRKKLQREGIVLPHKVDEIWGLLVTETQKTREMAGRYLKLVEGKKKTKKTVGEGDKVDLLWELLVAEEKAVVEGEDEVEAGVEGKSNNSRPALDIDTASWTGIGPEEATDSGSETVLTPSSNSDSDNAPCTERRDFTAPAATY
ncbi:hypothetical protein N657DRAFT_692013 [Parathielavia appendiculata]|uniref:Uncharacterized protein n=1 Tax=Parathielavia appendiculata TaxID=2587402 RepID=A0AAN6TVD9_9PEZI|nr:hypothetical protein N657DRAFT_692013 [Parathielavia appendiculata]